MSVKEALEKYSRRHLGIKKERQKNSKPEKEVESKVVAWCRSNGFEMSVIESKAVFNRAAGRYIKGQTDAGHCDMAGIIGDGSGCGAFIELKAPNKVKNISPAQYDFLLAKINKGAFGCCIDSVELLNKIYYGWLQLKHKNPLEAKAYLISFLPVPKSVKEQNAPLGL